MQILDDNSRRKRTFNRISSIKKVKPLKVIEIRTRLLSRQLLRLREFVDAQHRIFNLISQTAAHANVIAKSASLAERAFAFNSVLEKTVRCLCEVSPDLAVRCQLLVVSAEDLSSH